MTTVGAVTCSDCGRDKVSGQPHSCGIDPPEPDRDFLTRLKRLSSRVIGPAFVVEKQPAPKTTTPCVNDEDTPLPAKAPPEAELLPLDELVRQLRLHVERLQAQVAQAAPYDTTPGHILDDIEVLRALGNHLDDPILPCSIDQLTPEQEADCQLHMETDDSLAAILLRRIAHATHDGKLLACVNSAAKGEQHVKKIEEAKLLAAIHDFERDRLARVTAEYDPPPAPRAQAKKLLRKRRRKQRRK